MADPNPYSIIAEGLKTIFDAEFAAEGVTLEHDKLHESLGATNPVAGVYPAETRTSTSRAGAIALDHIVMVQYFDLWTPEISPETIIDPRIITDYATRFQRAVQASTASTPGSPEVYFFNVIHVSYPDDPTGNKSRFVATVRAFGDNIGLIETR